MLQPHSQRKGTHSTYEPIHTPTESLNILSRLFSILGIGKVPLMLVVSIFCLIWGATGVAANQIFAMVLRTPALYVWPSMICAFLISYVTTSGLSQLISRMMPQLETYGTEEGLLVGRIARAAYALDANPDQHSCLTISRIEFRFVAEPMTAPLSRVVQNCSCSNMTRRHAFSRSHGSNGTCQPIDQPQLLKQN